MKISYFTRSFMILSILAVFSSGSLASDHTQKNYFFENDVMNQVFWGHHHFDCGKYTANSACLPVYSHGSIFHRLNRAFPYRGRIARDDVKITLNAIDGIAKCMMEYCETYIALEKRHVVMVSEVLISAVSYLRCIVDLPEDEYSELSHKYYIEYYNGQKVASNKQNDRYLAYLFVSSKQFPNCIVSEPVTAALAMLRRLGQIRRLNRH